MNAPSIPDKNNKPADVLLLPSWYLPMGGEFCREQAWYLNRAGLTVDILANISLPWRKCALQLLTESWKDQSFVDDGIFTYRRFHRPIPRQDEINTRRWVQSTITLFQRYIALRGKPRLIHAHSSTWAGYAASIIREKYQIPYLITEHRGIFGLRSSLAVSSFKPYYTPLLRDAFSHASHIIGVSDQQLPKIQTYLTQEVPLTVLSNIVDTDFFSPRSLRQQGKGFRFISVNSYRDVKGYDILLPAFDQVCRQFPETKLILVGEDFDDPVFRKVYQRCTCKDSIHFTGLLTREEVREALGQSHALVISSRVEAQSISVLEALSMGLPVVCTEPIPEYVVGSGQGIRVPVEDVNALAAAMSTMIRKSTEYNPEQLARHAKEIASPRHVTQKLREIYHTILFDENKREVFKKNGS